MSSNTTKNEFQHNQNECPKVFVDYTFLEMHYLHLECNYFKIKSHKAKAELVDVKMKVQIKAFFSLPRLVAEKNLLTKPNFTALCTSKMVSTMAYLALQCLPRLVVGFGQRHSHPVRPVMDAHVKGPYDKQQTMLNHHKNQQILLGRVVR